MQFILNPEKGTWSLLSPHLDGPSLEDVWMRVNYHMGPKSLLRTGKRKFQFLEKWHNPKISKSQDVLTSHGNLKMIVVTMGPDVNGISYRLEFALSKENPIFLWRITLENGGKNNILVDGFEVLRAGFFPKRKLLPNPGPLSIKIQSKPIGYGAVRPSPNPGDLGFYSNGWQSWSHSGVYDSDDVYRASQLGLFASPIYYSSGKTPKMKPGHLTSDMYGILGDKVHRSGILAGFISQKQQFGSLDAYIADPLYPALSLWADGDQTHLNPGAEMTTDWAVIQFVDLDSPDPIAPYLDAVVQEHQILTSQVSPTPPTGWCSWYHYFEDIDEQKIRENLKSAVKIQSSVPLDLFQIDSGFEAKIGDWFDFSPGFPDGIAPLSEEIKSAGMTPGLWLAPFIVHSRSKLARKHRDWLLKGRTGLLASAGFIWNNFNKALDLTHPEALEYVCNVVRTAVQEWGYSYLKLDFLYAAAVKGRYRDRTQTRAQVLRTGLEAIRDAVGSEVVLLGCGVPLGSAVGIFDAVRIGADVDPGWEPNFILPPVLIRREPNLPSTRNALQNTLTRASLHNRWWGNDPDCLLIRPETDLTLAEVRSLSTAIAMSGGSMLLSDDLAKLPEDRLKIAEQMIPLIGKRPRVIDWFDSPTPSLLRVDLSNQTGNWHLLSVFNWSNDEQDLTIPLGKFGLPAGDFFVREFWNGTTSMVSDGELVLKGIPSHGVALLSLRQQRADQYLYLGSSFHVSQGLEVTDWSGEPQNGIRMQLNRPGKAHGMVDVYCPRPPEKIVSNNGKIEWHLLQDRCYRIILEFEKQVILEII